MKDIISSTSNPQIKNLNLLQKKSKARFEQGLFVVEGTKMIEEAYALNRLHKVYVSESFFKQKCNIHNFLLQTDYEIVRDEVFRSVSDTMTPQGVMATVKMQQISMETILGLPIVKLLLLEDIRDPGNLGTMIRTAEGAGCTAVILSKESVDLYNPKVVRSTMGSIYRVPVIFVENFIEALKQVKEQKVTLYAAHLQGKRKYYDEDYQDKCGILIGNEANGLSEQVSNMADQKLIIPMGGKLESLNAAIAAALLMYEAFERRAKKE